MRFLTTITLAVLTASVTAVPVAVLPSLIHPPVHVFRADPADEAVEGEPNIEARDNFDLEPEIHARDEPHIQARSEAAAAGIDPNYHIVDAKGITPEDDWKYRDNLAKLNANNCGKDCYRSINSYRSRVSREHRPYYDRSTDYHANNYDHHDNYGVQRSSRASRGEHNTPADDWKYKDNLVKQDNHNCGTHCEASLNSYRSVASKDSRLAREKDYHDYNHQDDKYNNWYPKDYHTNGNGYNNHNNGHYDDRTLRTNTYYPKDHHPTKYNDIHHNDYHGNNYHTNGNDYHGKNYHTNGNNYHGNKYHINGNGYDHHNNGHDYGVQRSSRASRGEHNTRQDEINHKNNHEKLDAGHCGQGCQLSINSYHSVASADSRRSRQSRNSRGNHGH
ncbi:hypothetical protein BDP81DRAFT_449088 [Colletotrichum phormii]|uniref:Uncharacterized protein n=1 Tax=Colletotrichum phormii TaxID=359342 RepID=A0AAI9ZRV4_9PEZI|nr:uncharacterized protein BDP81DRAFT_449088 [Colletotrichum phormii]KAK1636958.1 hypothetical protein BDP81DRAFT_449088 [Colletotrichum phormii]